MGDHRTVQRPSEGKKKALLTSLKLVQVNISMVVDDAEAINLVRHLHQEFFETPLADVGVSESFDDVALHAPSTPTQSR